MTVSEFIHAADSLVGAHFPDVEVTGEIFQITKHVSGHWYFTLKDECAQVAAVMYRNANARVRFEVKNGVRVVVRGAAKVFDRQGAFQLQVRQMSPLGFGELEFAFNQLRERLGAEGLFAPEHKKPLPRLPRRIAVITAVPSAAFADMARLAAARWGLCEVLAIGSLVQGERAAANLTHALRVADTLGADAIVLARGGGSREDLWAFNDEGLARAIFAARTPVVSAVGHEVDWTICDYVADHRSPTPTAAMVDLLPAAADVAGRLDELANGLFMAAAGRLRGAEYALNLAHSRLKSGALAARLAQGERRLGVACERLRGAVGARVFGFERRLNAAAARLGAGAVAARIAQGERRLGVAVARLNAGVVAARLAQGERRVFELSRRLRGALDGRIAAAAAAVGACEARLSAKAEFFARAGDFALLYKDGRKVLLGELASGDEVVISTTTATRTATIK